MPESLYQQQEYEIATLSHRPTAEELRDLRFVVVIDSTTNQTGVVGRIWEAPGSAGEPYMLVEDEQGQEELCLLHLSDDGLHLYAHSSLREAKIVVLAVSDLESRYTTEDSSDPLLITGLPLLVDISGTSDTIQGVVGITNNIADYPINIFSDGTTVYVITSAGEMVTVSSFDIVPAEGEQYRLTTIDAVELGRLIAVYSRVFTQGYEAMARLLDDTPDYPSLSMNIINGEKSDIPLVVIGTNPSLPKECLNGQTLEIMTNVAVGDSSLANLRLLVRIGAETTNSLPSNTENGWEWIIWGVKIADTSHIQSPTKNVVLDLYTRPSGGHAYINSVSI